MFSEVIVLSSDDEDDNWLAVKHKRSKIQHVDADLAVIEKAITVEFSEKKALHFSKRLEEKPAQDDDCCILSHDPEDDLHVPEFRANDADDLVIVKERGLVACRDFPHARHLCVKFPYATTPHEKYCEQCHCYVCDVLAPCRHWGKGRQSSDHCHAFDEDEKWKTLRSQTRSRLVKLSTRSQISGQGEMSIQPQRRTFSQARVRAISSAGLNGRPHSSSINANLPSLNQGPPNLIGMHSNWCPYVPLNQSSMSSNGLHGNWMVTSETNPQHVGNIVENNRAKGIVQYRNPAANIPAASLPSPIPQSWSQQQFQTTLLAPHTNLQTAACGRVPILPNTPVTALQPEVHLPNFTSSRMQHYPGQRTGSFSEVPENLHATPERISTMSSALSVGNITKDLMTLQNYLLEGISGPPYQSSTAHESNVKDTGHLSFSGNSVVQNPLQTVHSGEMDLLHNPFGPSETLPSYNSVAAARAVNARTSQLVDKDIWNIPVNGAGNKKSTEYLLNNGIEMNNFSLLDHNLVGFDQEFWTLLEPAAYPGF